MTLLAVLFMMNKEIVLIPVQLEPLPLIINAVSDIVLSLYDDYYFAFFQMTSPIIPQ